MTRRADIEAAKGLTIVLVVFGHLVARGDPQGADWYEVFRRVLYAFHMPFFLYLSGLLAASPGLALAPRARLWAVAQSRAKRLLLPFFGLGALIVLGKAALGHVIYVDNAPASLHAGLLDLIWHTAASPALTMWYLFVLFALTLLAVLTLNGAPERWPWFFAACVVAGALPVPAYLYADRVAEFAPYFALGLGAGLAGPRWNAMLTRLWRPALALFTLGSLIIAVFGFGWNDRAELCIMGPLSMPAIHGTLRELKLVSSSSVLPWFGRHSFMIYLGNTLFIGLAKGVLLGFTSWDGAHFYGFAAVMMASGLLGPVALKRTILSRIRVLDRLTN